jgi:exopolyphosphatase/guanosine-5'-triphosphate,3'-diphosphate pyrophosphatase
MFLEADPPLPEQLHRMREYIEERIAGIPERFGTGWDRAIATSATASAVVCAVNRIPRPRRDEADRKRASAAEIRKLYGRLAELNLAGRRKVTGIGPSRAEIIVAGAAVLNYIVEAFGLPSVYYSAAGVRDGIVADLAASGVGRELAELSREQRKEVERLGRKYGVPLAHARKVAELAHKLYASLQPLHGLPPAHGKVLEAAAFLHDVGHYVNDASHHKHSYYLVANSDLSGFTSRERELIANLCRYHRKAMPTPAHANNLGLGADEKRAVQLLAPILRLADNLDRSQEQRVESVVCQVADGQVTLRLQGSSDIDLEQWAAERAGEAFRQVYGKTVVVAKGPLR